MNRTLARMVLKAKANGWDTWVTVAEDQADLEVAACFTKGPTRIWSFWPDCRFRSAWYATGLAPVGCRELERLLSVSDSAVTESSVTD